MAKLGERMTQAKIKDHLRSFVDVDPDGDVEPMRLTLDTTRQWVRVQCPAEGHEHLIEQPADPEEAVAYECAPCNGARYALVDPPAADVPAAEEVTP